MATIDGRKTGGRKKGTPNKATRAAREALAKLIDGNIDRLQDWLDEIAEESPLEAFKAFCALLEYHVPKLARSEIGGADGRELMPTRIEIVAVAGRTEKDD